MLLLFEPETQRLNQADKYIGRDAGRQVGG